ncbi:MAG TPA: M14 family zinc carboxypeptidase [Frankiaceae bacterium]|nr:M14 family zinc carboxypeptidase [Frankiaceae bacterium]
MGALRVRHLLLAAALLGSVALTPAADAADPPRTGFEESDGATWTTHEEEVEFLEAVDAGSPYATVEVIGTTLEDRPIHLVTLGAPAPRNAAQGRTEPVELHICTQHGNEPAGREACLQKLRDLAFAEDPAVIEQLTEQTILFVPTANPDGRASNSRENSEGVDVNRDHLNLGSLEAQAMAKVIRDWQPDISIDHHEYGPGEPILYDDEVLYLWPRNLNVDEAVHDLGVTFSKEVLAPCLAEKGFTSDEYGIDAVGSTDLQQTAGGGDEGILRNAAGLRHVVGILVESAVTMNLTNGPDEATTPGVQLRRVASQVATIDCTLGYVADTAAALTAATAGAPLRKTAEGKRQDTPVYLAGQDEDTTVTGNGDAEETIDPPCAYDLDATQLEAVDEILDLHGIAKVPLGSGARVLMAQPAEPVIPLLLDERNDRAETDATARETCTSAAPDTKTPPKEPRQAPPRTGAGGSGLPATGLPGSLAVVAALATGVAAALRRSAS